MKKTILAIFAHPDDESFGPAGTIALLAKSHDVHVICATKGEAGENHHDDQSRHIAEIRAEEIVSSSKILGVKDVHFLGFHDGMLSNNLYQPLVDKVQTFVDIYKPEILMSYDKLGNSGHIDHIVMSLVTTFIFERNQQIKKLMYYVVHEELHKLRTTPYFIHLPSPYRDDQIDEAIDVTSVWDKKLAAIKTHTSQKKDAAGLLARLDQHAKREYFIISQRK